jgi:hypothetical protein
VVLDGMAYPELRLGILGNKQMVEMNTIIDVSNGKLYIKH